MSKHGFYQNRAKMNFAMNTFLFTVKTTQGGHSPEWQTSGQR